MFSSFMMRVVVSVFATAFLSIGITVFYGIRAMDHWQTSDMRERMLSEANLAARVYTLSGNDAIGVLAILSESEGSLRLTVADDEGRVFYDSTLDKRLADFDNHKFRPEIIEATRSGKGFSIRDSESIVSQRFAYAAARTIDGGTVRLAVPISTMRDSFWERSGMFLQIGGIAAIISLIFATMVSLSLKKSFVPLVNVVEDIAGGRLDRRLEHYPGREFAPLADAVNTMAQRIEEQVHAYADQTAQLETILNTMSDGVLVLDPRGNIRSCNKTLDRVFPGVAAAGGQSLEGAVSYASLNNAVADVLGTREGKPLDASGQTVSLHMALDSGRVFSVLLARPQRPDPRCGLVAVFHDVTDIMRLERVRRDFVANVSHELRTPLTTITGYAETLMTVEDPEQCRLFAGVILRNASGLERMIRDMLSLSRLEREGAYYPLSPVSVEEAVDEALSSCGRAFEGRGVRVEREIPADCAVMADAAYLSQVFRNLLENAARYAVGGSAVRVRVTRSGDQALCRVTNTGPIIPAEDQERIFERFYSVERHRGSANTGLGLAICRHIVERFRGRIWAESPDEDGATSFVFTLGAADPDASASQAEDTGAEV